MSLRDDWKLLQRLKISDKINDYVSKTQHQCSYSTVGLKPRALKMISQLLGNHNAEGNGDLANKKLKTTVRMSYIKCNSLAPSNYKVTKYEIMLTANVTQVVEYMLCMYVQVPEFNPQFYVASINTVYVLQSSNTIKCGP